MSSAGIEEFLWRQAELAELGSPSNIIVPCGKIVAPTKTILSSICIELKMYLCTKITTTPQSNTLSMLLEVSSCVDYTSRGCLRNRTAKGTVQYRCVINMTS